MAFFKKVEGDGAVMVIGGVYKQVELATRDGYIYAAVAGGYVRLMADGSTSKPNMRLDFMSWDGALSQKLGRLAMGDTPGTKPLGAPEAQKLLGSE